MDFMVLPVKSTSVCALEKYGSYIWPLAIGNASEPYYDWLSNNFQIAKIISESISENELALCQYHL